MILKYVKPGLFVLLAFEIASIFLMLRAYDKLVSDPKNYSSTAIVQNREKRDKVIEKRAEKIKIEGVPFTSQSPDGSWDHIAQELCEEASMIMVDRYWSKKPLTKNIALEELKNLAEFERVSYGDWRDENAAQIAQRLRDYFGYGSVSVFYDFSLDFLKEKLAEGRPIIVPAAGRELKNPNFRAPGPLYHALVITGYDGKNFITNDPGTKKGEDWKYAESILYGAIHDFPGSKEEILKGKKAMIIVNVNGI